MIDITLILTALVVIFVSWIIFQLVLKSKSESTRPRNLVFDPTAADEDEDGTFDTSKEPACLNCGKTAAEASEADGGGTTAVLKLKRCSSCMTALYCSRECSKAAWPIHKNVCSQTRKLDIFAFAPLFASVAQLARTMGVTLSGLDVNLTNNALRHRVMKKENRDGEVLLHLGPGPEDRPFQPNNLDASGDGQFSGTRLHLSMASDGHAIAASLGMLFAFQQALTVYNAEHEGDKRIQLAFKGQRIKEFGLAVGRSRAAWSLAYKYPDGHVERRQSLNKHCWMYFACEDGKTELLLDVSAAPLGGQTAVINALDYLPQEGSLRKMLGPPRGAMLPAPIMLLVVKPPSPDGQSAAPPKPEPGKPTVYPQEMFVEQRVRIPLSEEIWDRRMYANYTSFVEETLKDGMAELQELQGESAVEGQEGFVGEEDGSGRAKDYLPPDKWESGFMFYALADETVKAALKEESFTNWPADGFLRNIAQ